MKLNKLLLIFSLLCMLVFSSCGEKTKEQVFDCIAVKLNKEATKISLIDFDGKIIVQDEFDGRSSILPINDVITEITFDGKAKYWKIENNKVVPLIDKTFLGGTPFYENVAVVTDDQGKLSLINKKGEPIIADLSKVQEYQVLKVGVMSEGLLRFQASNGKWGYINEKGEVIIKPTYKKCENFVNGYARVNNENNIFNVINKQGDVVFKGEEKANYLPLNNDLVLFYKIDKDENTHYFLTNLKGEKIIDNKYSEAWFVTNNMLPVQNEDKQWGVINTKQEVVGELRFKFEEAPIISKSGSVVAKIDKKNKLFNNKGEFIANLEEYKHITPVAPNRFVAEKENNKFDILNETGKVVSTDSYIWAMNYSLSIPYNFFEKPEVVMNFYTAESKYFDFESVFANGFNSITPTGIAGINNYSNIGNVLQKFPYSTKQFSNVNNENFEDYQFYFYSNFQNETTERNSINNQEINTRRDDDASYTDTAAYYPQIKSEADINDKYPYLDMYNSNYNTYKKGIVEGLIFGYEFTFDQGLKIPITGVDPIFVDQITTIGYDLNLSARITQFSVDYELGKIDSQLFKQRLHDKLISSGWHLLSSNKDTYANNTNNNKIYLGVQSLTFYYH